MEDIENIEVQIEDLRKQLTTLKAALKTEQKKRRAYFPDKLNLSEGIWRISGDLIGKAIITEVYALFREDGLPLHEGKKNPMTMADNEYELYKKAFVIVAEALVKARNEYKNELT